MAYEKIDGEIAVAIAAELNMDPVKDRAKLTHWARIIRVAHRVLDERALEQERPSGGWAPPPSKSRPGEILSAKRNIKTGEIRS